MNKYRDEKEKFENALSNFASNLGEYISYNDEWTIKGFIDIFKNIYTISSDTKIISKILELHLFPLFLKFADDIDYDIELATYQNWYPDITFISRNNRDIKFAVDLKTTYRKKDDPEYCNGFTLGSHGEYFVNRQSSKNIQYPYDDYEAHYCLGIIYSRNSLDDYSETKLYPLSELNNIKSVINNFIFFVNEKWKIAGDTSGSGNTANIGSITNINDIINGNGVFAKAGEDLFNDYWINYGKIKIINDKGITKNMSSFEEYLKYRKLSPSLNNKKYKGHKNV